MIVKLDLFRDLGKITDRKKEKTGTYASAQEEVVIRMLPQGSDLEGSVAEHIECVRKEVTAGTTGTCFCSFLVH